MGAPIRSYTNGYDAFVAKLNSTGVLQWNTFLGGNGEEICDFQGLGFAITVDENSNVFVTGYSTATWGSPIHAYSGGYSDSFVAKLNSNGILQWNTFLGGAGFDLSFSITNDESGNIFIGGTSEATWGIPLQTYSNSEDAFIAKLNSNGMLQWNTFLGGNGYDTGLAVTYHNGSLFMMGMSTATWGMPIHPHSGAMDFYVAKLSPAKPPLIIVHGWQGGAYFDGDPNTNGYHVSDDGDATNDIILYDGTNPSISTLSSLPESFLEDYQVWIAHLETSPSGTPHLEKNAKYLKEQIEYVYSQNPQDITIIAHSMGGVVSRAAIQGLNYVDSLYTLGSPHAGIPHLKNVYPELFDQFAMNDMDTSKINYFNQRNKNINGVNYYFIGGDASPFHPLSILFYGILGQKHDGLVGSYSSVGWVYPDKAFDPTGWIGTSFLGQYWTDETHSISYDEYINYYTTPPGDLHSFSVECIKALMKEGPINDLYCRDAKQGVASGQGITAQDLNSQTTLTFSSFTVLKTGQLTGSQSISVPLDIDSNSASLFYLTWNGATPTFTLTRPVDNVIVDQSYANSHPAEVVFETALGGVDSPPYAYYKFANTQPGIWQLNITSTGDVEYQVFAALETNRTLSVLTDKDVYEIGDNALFSATLSQDDAAIPDAIVEASLTFQDASVVNVSLSDPENDGTYSTSYTIPDAPGYLTIDVNASGVDGGVPYTRNTLLIAAIAPNDLSLTGVYSETPTDDDLNGLYEKLNFNIEVNLVEAGEYAVTAELYAGDQLITQSGDFFDLASGAQTITLPFDGDAIRQAGLHGPYTITNLYLTPIEVGITAQSGIDVLQTPASKYTQFGYENNTPTFTDVPFNGFGWAHIEAIYNAGITGGCTTNPLNYCPNNTVTRAQMAIFLLRGIHGSSYTPPAVGDGTGFNDVPTTHSAAAWIKQLAAEGITGGCGNGNYCPNQAVTRAQMAIFLLRAKYGDDYVPPAVGGSSGFNDVPAGSSTAPWIKQLAAENITGGCGNGNFCPNNPVTRSQMAIFLQRTFNLPLP